MIVVDTNILAYLFIAGEKTALAQQLFQREPVWITPAIWPHEFLNVLASFVKFGGGTIEEARNIWQQSQRFMAGRVVETNLAQALELAVLHDLSTYDAQYVTLAQNKQCLLVTEDKKLTGKLPGTAVSMTDFLQTGD
jgi:predicted nucleic acid-binding protein